MEATVLLRRHPSLRNHLSMIVWPILAIPILLYLLKAYVWKDIPVLVMVIIGLVLLMFPAYAWLRSKFHTYVVTETTIHARRGLLSKFINEIRIADVRAINVRQGLLQRIMGVGQVGFSSAAGDAEEVVFTGIRDPDGVKQLIQSRMAEIKDNDDGE